MNDKKIIKVNTGNRNNIFRCISMYFNAFLLVLAFIFLSTGAVYSQGSDSLFYYLELSAKNNPSVLQKFSEYNAAVQKIAQAGALPDPELNAGIFLSPMELVMGKQIADLRLMQMFPWFGTLSAAKDEMSLMAKADYEDFKDAKLQVFYDVQLSWYELQKIAVSIEIAEKNREILRTLESISIARFKSPSSSGTGAATGQGNMPGNNGGGQQPQTGQGMQGIGANNRQGNNTGPQIQQPAPSMQENSMSTAVTGLPEIYRIRIEITDLENSIALLNSRKKTELARFNSFLNRAAESPVFLPDSLTADTTEIDYGNVSDSSLANNPMLAMIAYEQQSLEAREKMVTRMGYPMIGLGVDYSVIGKNEMAESDMNGKDMVMPMVSVTLPLNRKKYKAMREETMNMNNAKKENYVSMENSLRTDLYEAIQMYEDAKRRIKLYEMQSGLSQQSLEIMVRSFSVSGAGLTDILQVQRQNLDYEQKKTEAAADYNIAVAQIKRISGGSE
jgi:outer membrane protein TolC